MVKQIKRKGARFQAKEQTFARDLWRYEDKE